MSDVIHTLYILHKTDEFCLTGGENVIIASVVVRASHTSY